MASTRKTQSQSPTPLPAGELVRALWIGDPGRGKTCHMAALANVGRIVYIDAENRLKRSVLLRLGINADNIERYAGRTVTFGQLEKLAFMLAEQADAGHPKTGVIFDSITELHRLLLRELVDDAVIVAAQKDKVRFPWQTYIDDYGDMTNQLRILLRRYRDLNLHLGFSAHAGRDLDEEGKVRVTADLTRAARSDLMGYVDVALNCQYAEFDGVPEFTAWTRPVGRFDAKDAFGVLPTMLVLPTFPRLLSYVNGQLDRDQDPEQAAARARRQGPAPAEEAS